MTAFDVLTLGRVGVDIYPNQVGVGLEDVRSFSKFLGGTATNVAVAAARYGHRSAVITRVGSDPFGRYVRSALTRFRVSDRYVGTVPALPTPVTFCEIFPPDHFPIYFYRYPTAPDLQIRPDELDLPAIRSARIFWVTGSGLCQEPSRSATLAALEARGRSGITVLDLDYRPMFWDSPTDAARQAQRALQMVTVVVGNREEWAMATGEHEPGAAASSLLGAGVALAVVKLGPEGVLAADATGSTAVPPVPVDVVNGLGAGDAFGGALCHGLLLGWPTKRTMRFANAAGAIVASQLACADAMPDADEVERKMKEGPGG